MVTLAKFNTICFVRIVRLFPACLAICLAVPSAALSAPREIRIPPVGETIKVDVMRGGSAVITMKAFEGRGNPLAYEFASRPRHGRLEDFQQAEEDRQGFASVVYVHGDDEDSQEDEFTFKARTLIGGGVSSPIKVRVHISDAAPQLQIVRALDFSAAAGECESKQIELANIGGGLLEGRIAPKEPFYVEGEGRFSLGRGKTTNIAVRFAPQSTDSVAPQTLTPARANPGAKITLRGTANAPFSACVEDIQVLPDGAREGSITITNLSNASLNAAIGIEPRNAVEAEKMVRISKGEVYRTPMKIGADRKGGEMEIRVSIGSQHYFQELPVRVPEVPANPDLITPLLDFRKRAEAALVVTNRGGMEARFDLELPENIKPDGGALNFSVAPEQTKEVRLHISDIGKSCSKTVFVDFRQGEKVPVAVLWPARAQVLTKTLDFRDADEAEVIVTNTGDIEALLSLAMPTGIRLMAEPKDLVVAPLSQTKLRVKLETAENLPSGACLALDLGRNDKVRLPIILRSFKPPNNSHFAWNINEDVKLQASANRRDGISWLSTKSDWLDAQLLVVRDGVISVYQAAPEGGGWFDAMKLWWQGMGAFFNKRVGPLEEETDDKDAVVKEHSNWSRVDMPAEDYQNAALVWRIQARSSKTDSVEQTSEDFRIDLTKQLLVPVYMSSSQPHGVPPYQQSSVLSSQVEGSDLLVTVALPEADKDTEFDVERIVGFFDSAGEDTSAAPYATKRFSPAEAFVDAKRATIVEVKSSVGDTEKKVEARTLTVRFKDLERGAAMYCRLVPKQNSHNSRPSLPFLVMGPPSLDFSWKWLLVAIAGTLTILLVWTRLKAASN